MIIIVSAIIAIGFGILLLILFMKDILYDMALNVGVCFFVLGFLTVLFCGIGYAEKRADIKHDIESKTIERLGIEQYYREAMQTSDKHRQMSAIAKIATWNDEVESYKRHTQNPIIGDFYPEEVAESLQYIDLESEDLCTK